MQSCCISWAELLHSVSSSSVRIESQSQNLEAIAMEMSIFAKEMAVGVEILWQRYSIITDPVERSIFCWAG